MKKILISLSIIGVVGAIAVGGTIAYFSDTETSTGNTFTAGTIDIAIDAENPWTSHYDIGDLKPGETGNINFDITNVGANPVNVSKTLTSIVGNGGAATYACPAAGQYPIYSASSEPECVAEAGIPNDNVASQIIYDLSVEVYNDQDVKIWWQSIYTDADGKKITDVYGSTGGQYVTLGMIPVDGHMEVTQSYHFSADAGNEYQGDALSFDITIKGEQLASNNGYASVVLDNKTAGPEYAVIADDYQGTLTYKTMNPTFDFSFTGKVTKPNTQYTLLYAVDPWPQTGSKVLGTVMSDGSGQVNFLGTATPGSIVNGKVWLVLSTDWNVTQMSGWHQADYLLETGLINYTKN